MAKKNIILLFFLAILISCKTNKPNSHIETFYNYPNPFNPREEITTFIVGITTGEIIEGNIEIFTKSGNLIDSKKLTVNEEDKTKATCIWSGIDKNGKYIVPNVYISKVTIKDNTDTTFIKEFHTTIR